MIVLISKMMLIENIHECFWSSDIFNSADLEELSCDKKDLVGVICKSDLQPSLVVVYACV